MTNDIYSYLQKLHAFVESLELRIHNLEQSIASLKDEVVLLANRPPIKIDTIEYKFDQLKVETLDGTLNIGLNPSDLQNIEDFAVDHNNTLKTPFSPQQHMQRTIEIEDKMSQYLEEHLPHVIADVQKKYELTLDESYISFIKEDIKKQLPIRIEHHLKQSEFTRVEGTAENLSDKIVEQLIKEIQNGVQTFISHLPENMKGMKTT
ncbi:spore gernimation protein [Bacillus sp. Bva_UNVM-123]|uniref:spore germination protein GerPC n=1 Tax=Bacillus sp. Bva_UNVM-123 TaxID=2829798 RepID=UPI00391F1E87